MSWPALPDIDFGQSTAVDPSQFVNRISHWDLTDTLGHAPVISVAAADTPAEIRQMAAPRFRCTGTDDHLVAQEAHAEIPLVGSFRRGRLMLLPGSYSFGGKLSLGLLVHLEAAGAVIDYQGSYLGTLLELTDNLSAVSGGFWNSNGLNATSPVVDVAGGRCVAERIRTLGGTGTSLRVSGDRAFILGCETYNTQITGNDNRIIGIEDLSDFTVAANASRNRLTALKVTGTITDSGDGTRYPPGYQLGHAQIVVDHALTGTEADITGLATAVLNATVSAPRHVRVRAHFSTANDTAGGRNKFNLKTLAGAYLDEQTIYHAVANDLYRCTMEWQGTITADTGWEVRGFEVSGQGKVAAAATWPAFIEVLDLGGLT